MTNIKLCFIMDCTGSMEPWIQASKDYICSIVDDTVKQYPDSKFYIGFIGYRDYGDDERFIIKKFREVNGFVNSIQHVHAEGGNDEAEDVLGGFKHAVALDWSDADIRIVFHIADAPAHGNIFHNKSISDRYPNGDPTFEDPRAYIRKFSELDIDFTFVKINASTDTMIEQFNRCWMGNGQFRVIDLHNKNDFKRQLTRSVISSIERYSASQAQEEE